jgi:anti-sigma regulatory factor (Ser/Thr protein kinase)
MSKASATLPQTRVFEGLPEEIGSVRTFVAQAAKDCPVVDDVVLLASELATNAVLHTASGSDGTFSVFVYLGGGGVRVEVHDLGSDTEPAFGGSASLEESGAGLFLVESMADTCGHYGGPTGRVVWFEVSAG